MDQQYPTVAKIPVLDIGKFKQCQFRIQQYLQHEHYALWEVIEFKDSYTVPASSSSTTTTDTTSDEFGKKSGRTVTLTAEDMQKKKNDVKARTTLLLSIPDEHQPRFKGSETLEQTFNRLQVIVAKHSSRNKDGKTACVSTASTNVPTASASVATISQDTACAYIASQSSGFDKTKVECFNCHKMGHFARECRAPRSQERGRKEGYRQGSKTEEKTPKALMAIDGVGWDWSYMENEGEDHALVADGETPTEFALMANTESKVKLENDGLDGKLAGLLKASKNLDHLIKSQRSDQVKKGVGYNDVPPPAADLPEFMDDTVTDYIRP
nr:hypothetical protein [Tanacetum cinerariifolium]